MLAQDHSPLFQIQLAIIAISLSVILFLLPVIKSPVPATFGAMGAIVTAVVTMLMLRANKVEAARNWMAFALLGTTTLANILDSGPLSVETAAFMIVLVVGGMTLNRVPLIVLIGSSIACLIVVASLRYGDYAARNAFHDLIGTTLAFVMIFTIVGVFVYLARRNLLSAVATAHRSEVVIAQRNRELLAEIAERKLAEQRVAARAKELEALLLVSNTISSTLELQPLLTGIVEKLGEVIPFDALEICELKPDGVLIPLHVSGPREYRDALLRTPRRHVAGDDILLDRIVNSKSPLRISINDSDGALLQAHASRMQRLLNTAPVYVNESITVPLIMREQVCGYMQINGVAQRRYTDTTVALAHAFGNLIGASIEKAQLYERAMESATLGERGRIARELHDSVSQALFGIVLGMRTIMQLAQQGREAPPDTFEYVYKLAEAALSETRALVFELRPEYLEKEGLIAAFAKQAQTLCTRHEIQVNTMMCATEPDIPFKAKEAIYRMALEAVQNTIKHARATRVDLRMQQRAGLLVIEVQDNGRGFDASNTPDGHFGMKTMRERAAHIGAMLDLRTEPGHGTLIRITLPVPGAPDCAG